MTNNYTQYQNLYQHSITNPEQFWDEIAQEYISWHKKYTKVYNGNIKSELNKDWFINGKLNACYNCLDRHLETDSKINKNKIAYYYQGDELDHTKTITYIELLEQVCIFARVLKKLDIKKSDKICIYMPLGIEAIVAILACARIGAIHTVVFAGFSGNSIADRIIDADCDLLITSLTTRRGGREIDLSKNINQALKILDAENYLSSNKKFKLLLVDNYYCNISNKDLKNILYINQNNLFNFNVLKSELKNNLSEYYIEPEWVDANHPLFILYTSGSTGKPKGVLHNTAGYLLYTAFSFNKIFNINKQDIYWCTADIGWIAGHSYVLYGPLCNHTTSVIYAGTPIHPDYNIFWRIIEKYKTTIFYTAPTAIRLLIQQGDKYLENIDLSSLRLLGSVGEPINPEAWLWFYHKVGKNNCSIIDTWWQTETSACMICPVDDKNLVKSKPGCAMLPFYGVNLAILDDNGLEIKYNKQDNKTKQGHLVVKSPWPGMITTVYKQTDRFYNTYLKVFKNYFYTGDLSKRDQDGHYWLLGREDDVINIAGHRLGTAEVESSLVSHELVAEAAVVTVPDLIKGEIIFAYVVLVNLDEQINQENNYKNIRDNLIKHVKNQIGPIVIFKDIIFTKNLPKTRSGKIMRRILKKLAVNKLDDLGDISTLDNPDVITEIKELI